MGASPSAIFSPTFSFSDIFYAKWEKIIEDYSARSLTYPKDKLPALSALARRFAQKTGCGYLAGHWREKIVHTLAWYISKPVSELPVYRAPTWSWASVDGKLRFNTSAHVRRWDAERISDSMILAGSDPFGQVSAGSSITIRARLKIAEARHVTVTEWPVCFLFEEGLMNKLGFCSLDHEFEVKDEETLYCMQIATFGFSAEHEPWTASAALLLRRVEMGNKIVYKRVGYVDLRRKGFEGKNIAEGSDWFKDEGFSELCIV